MYSSTTGKMVLITSTKTVCHWHSKGVFPRKFLLTNWLFIINCRSLQLQLHVIFPYRNRFLCLDHPCPSERPGETSQLTPRNFRGHRIVHRRDHASFSHVFCPMWKLGPSGNWGLACRKQGRAMAKVLGQGPASIFPDTLGLDVMPGWHLSRGEFGSYEGTIASPSFVWLGVHGTMLTSSRVVVLSLWVTTSLGVTY